MADLIAVVTTLATREQALALGRALVEARLAACAQIGAIDSVYRWDGALQCEPEWRLTCKTTAGRWSSIEAAIRERHPYALPQIVALALGPASAPYAAWVEAECGPAGSGTAPPEP